MGTTSVPDKICILSPGRCGSLLLEALLKIRFCDHLDDLYHTHDVSEALELEEQGFAVVTLRRQNIFNWVISYCVLNRLPDEYGVELEEEYYTANPDLRYSVHVDEYMEERNKLKTQLAQYKSEWAMYYYEDLAKEPFAIVSRILGGYPTVPKKNKLQYQSDKIISNLSELFRAESHCTPF